MVSSGIRAMSAFPLPSGKGVAGNVAANGVEKVAAAEGVSAANQGKDGEKDRLDFSPVGLRGMLDKMDLFGVKPRADGAIHLEDIRSNYAERFEQFSQKLNGLLKKAGIDRGCESILRSDGEGKIRVSNNHPEREKIEALFEDNPDLANEFRGLSGTASFLRAADEHLKFAAAYAKNPEAALQLFSHLFDKTDTREFALRVTDENIMGFFE